MTFRRLLPGVWGAIFISALVTITYQPSIAIGFFAEDYIGIDLCVRLEPLEYLWFFFDPRVPAGWYRPIQGLQLALEYLLFGTFAPPYHLVQILIHLGNCLLIYSLLFHVTRNWRVGAVATMMYATLPALSPAVMWVSVTDPLAAFFYLLAITLWWRYLKTQKRVVSGLALIVFVIALLSKEIGVTLIVALLFLDWCIVKSKPSLANLLRRYLPFIVILLLYSVYFIYRASAYLSDQYTGPYAGLGIGPHIVSNLRFYLGTLLIPWTSNQLLHTIFLLAVMPCFAYWIVGKRQAWIAFLSSMAICLLVPILPLPVPSARYLYLSLGVSAIFFTALVFFVLRQVNSRWVTGGVAAALTLIVFGNTLNIYEGAVGLTNFARSLRLPYRPIFQQHVVFDTDTYLYFVNSPTQTSILSGMFSARYGRKVIVSGTDVQSAANLRDHRSAYVIFFDDQNQIREQSVDTGVMTSVEPGLPSDFASSIRLTGYEIARARLKPGDTIVILWYWQATRRVDKNYTLFVHLVNQFGEMIANSDSEPRSGQLPTSQWRVGTRVVDWTILPIPTDIPSGSYTLEIGWYYFPTMERLLLDVLEETRDKVVIAPIVIE